MTKHEIYKKGLINYGYIVLLLLLDNNEQLENYEECSIIQEVLNQFSFDYQLEIPKRYSISQLEEFKNFGVNGELLIMNIPYYAEEIQMQIKDFENNSKKLLK